MKSPPSNIEVKAGREGWRWRGNDVIDRRAEVVTCMVGPCVPVCPHLTTPHHHFLVLEWQVNGKMPVGGHKYQNIILGLINTHNMITPTVSSLNNKKKRLLTSLFYTFYRDMTTLKGSFNELIIIIIMRVLCEQLWPLSSVIIISAANCSVSLSHCLTVSLSHCALCLVMTEGSPVWRRLWGR